MYSPNPPKILLIDDDPDITFAIKVVLEQEGYTILIANNGDDGLAMIREHHPDLVILDVMMTTKDEGFQVAYKLKNDPRYSDIPILISSAVSKETGFIFSPKTDEEWLPVEDMIEKPVHPNDLIKKVSALLKREK